MRVGPVPQSICCCHASNKEEGGDKGFRVRHRSQWVFHSFSPSDADPDSILQFALLKVIGPVVSLSAFSPAYGLSHHQLIQSTQAFIGQYKSVSANTSQYRPTSVNIGQLNAVIGQLRSSNQQSFNLFQAIGHDKHPLWTIFCIDRLLFILLFIHLNGGECGNDITSINNMSK